MPKIPKKIKLTSGEVKELKSKYDIVKKTFKKYWKIAVSGKSKPKPKSIFKHLKEFREDKERRMKEINNY